MKKRIIISVIIILVLFLAIFSFKKIYDYYRIKNAKIEVVLIDNLNIGIDDEVSLSDFIVSINGHYDDYKIDTSEIGEKLIKFNFINDDNIKVSYSFNINVVDDIEPLIMSGESYTVYIGSEDTLINDILSGDNIDNTPKREIIGEYDLNKLGTYPLQYVITDSSGNVSSKKFNLNVIEKPKTTYTEHHTDFKDIYNIHKTDNTLIGLDISKYQGDIDFDTIKSEGVSFVMIRVGTEKKDTGEFVLDPKFKQNIEGAIESGIDVGIYFYSYAKTKNEAIEDAKWVIDQIKDYKITMPVAFDWEDWTDFNSYNVSNKELTNIAYAYLNELNKKGYDTFLYSSKTYLQNIWANEKYDTWLAHYIDKTTYTGKYKMWQLCSDGVIDGINGYVDIDIYYKN